MQKDLNAENLAKQITTLLKHRKTIGLAAKQLARLDATEVVVHYCVAEAKL
jgi:UDP-N-acetylglucosamine:LPS N-acetylglucosamine transferase